MCVLFCVCVGCLSGQSVFFFNSNISPVSLSSLSLSRPLYMFVIYVFANQTSIYIHIYWTATATVDRTPPKKNKPN